MYIKLPGVEDMAQACKASILFPVEEVEVDSPSLSLTRDEQGTKPHLCKTVTDDGVRASKAGDVFRRSHAHRKQRGVDTRKVETIVYRGRRDQLEQSTINKRSDHATPGSKNVYRWRVLL